ncbi:MAG: endonuclease/exonuclease/phosphatase family protein, partial [Planctomycetaceae bacterium]|nr:endonuclease/exonuclease/phosphatase family protein [Planctomycetaceae bacterium]
INRHFAVDDGVPTILAGDMNALPDTEPIQILLKQWTNAIDKDATPTAPSTKPKSRIDYIFYRPATRFEMVESKVIDEPLASDHRPVFAILKLKQQ